ncbi:MAG: hypothetical protein HYY06_29515 [Deltaproteobacteria bacterium]|nr:hypothetical protein [Deltaproteobacteria bacterium]
MLVVAAVLLGCCSGGAPQSERVARVRRVELPPPAPPAPPAPAPARPPAPPAPAELLHLVPSQVVVSSIAGAVLHTAELVDGNLETAWNSAQDDVTRSWIAFRVPRDARVTSLRLTAGFVKVDGPRDFFTGNYRVRKVRVSRDGEALGEHALDPDDRGLQTIAVAGPGGEYRIDFVDLVAGTSERWRQTCVSELEVLGVPGAERHAAPAPPLVRIGSFAGIPAADGRVTPLVSARGMVVQKRPAIDRQDLARILQGAWLTPAEPRAWTVLGGDGGDRVALVWLTHRSGSERAAERRRARRGLRRLPAGSEGCSSEGACPELHAARVSLPARGVPQVERLVEIGEDMCGPDTYLEQSIGHADPAFGANFAGRIDLEELDADGSVEASFRVRWQTTPQCAVGYNELRRLLILDVESSQVQLEVTLFEHPQASSLPRVDTRLSPRDLDGDGHPDFEMRTTELLQCFGEERGPDCGYRTQDKTLLYDPASDRWIERPLAPSPASSP